MKAHEYSGDVKFIQNSLRKLWDHEITIDWDDDAMRLVCSINIPPVDIRVSGVGFDEAQDDIMVRVAAKMESIIRAEFKSWETRLRKDCVAAAKQEIADLNAIIAEHDGKGKGKK